MSAIKQDKTFNPTELPLSKVYSPVLPALDRIEELGKRAGISLRSFFFTHLALTRHPFLTSSDQEAPVAEYLGRLGKAAGGVVRRDNIGNIAIDFPGRGTGESSNPVILHGHSDMYCVGENKKPHNFKNNPMRRVVVDNYTAPGADTPIPQALKAEGTTWGHDGRAALSLAMWAAMDPSITNRPPIRVLVTVGEEKDFRGAKNIEPEFLQGAQALICLDTTTPAQIRVACGGLRSYSADLKVNRKQMPEGYRAVKIEISKLTEGHASLYPQNRAQATELLTSLLRDGYSRFKDLKLLDYQAGKPTSFFAIAEFGEVVVGLPESQVEEFKSFAAAFPGWEQARRKADPQLTVAITDTELTRSYISNGNELITHLGGIKTGVIAWEGAPGESAPRELSFIGSIRCTETSMKVQGGVRTYEPVTLDILEGRLSEHLSKLGEFEIVERDAPWCCPENHPLLKNALTAVQTAYGNASTVSYLSGLELGEFQRVAPKLPIIAMGPGIVGQHTANEALDLGTVVPCALSLKGILEHCVNGRAVERV